MEEDEEESKYEIFPWTLGKNWSKKIASFLQQRDELWARMDYRAAVSRHCCEEVTRGKINGVCFSNSKFSIKTVPVQVMAIAPSRSLWQRERLEHHSGAQRQYDDRPLAFPRGPSASPVSCALCDRGLVPDEALGPSFSRRASKENLIPGFLHPFTSAKKTLSRAAMQPSEVLPCRYRQNNQLNYVC